MVFKSYSLNLNSFFQFRRIIKNLEAMINNWKELPAGDTQTVKGVLAAEWRAADEATQTKVIQQFKESFREDCLGKQAISGLKNYSCFLNQDGHHVFHFSEWTDEALLDSFVHNDHVFSTSRLQKDSLVTSLWKNVYYPYQSHKESGKTIKSTGLIVFVKQYFQKQDQTKEWIDRILGTLVREGDHEGLIQNTYYLNKQGTALLNYALWENERSYQDFLQHHSPETRMDWEGIQNFSGWLSEKGVIRKHNKFENIYRRDA